MEKNYLMAKYWNEQIDNEYRDRDKLNDKNYFVVSFIKSCPSCGFIFQKIMNFESIDKMLGYIKYEIIRVAVGEELDFEYEKTMQADFDEIVSAIKENEYNANALKFWREIDEVISESDEAIKLSKIIDYMNRFNSDFLAPSWHDFEIIKPEESLIDFWTKFFVLDYDDEEDREEIDLVKKALADGNPDLLDEAIGHHNG